MIKDIRFGNSVIGENKPLYFIADIAANHDGNLDRALHLIELAKEAGAHAAKFQNFQASRIVSRSGFEQLGSNLSHQKKWKKSVFDIYQDASISFDWTSKLKEQCDKVGIDYFTSPYDFESVDKVDQYVDIYKIGSGDISWLEIIDYVASKNKPVMIATGASSLEDVQRAMSTLQEKTSSIVLMQCNTNYTAELENFKYINLSVLKTYRKLYPNTILGLSDHTPGHATVLGSVALGARVFEKHFTDDQRREGPDHKFSMTPTSWREMVNRADEVYQALGDGIKRVETNEKQAAIVQRRALRATEDFQIGDIIQKSSLEPLRPIPSNGVAPYELYNLIGKKLVKPLSAGELITLDHIAR